MMEGSVRLHTDVARFADLLRCRTSHEPAIAIDKTAIAGGVSGNVYRTNGSGVLLMAIDQLSREARSQQAHYDRIAQAYEANLGYPHTQEYMAYLDRALADATGPTRLGATAELCCGLGEALKLFSAQIDRYVGVDVSEKMLDAAAALHANKPALFVQGDATDTPLADNAFDTIMMLGGIHHVPDRQRLFTEINRILKPGGRLIYREPVSDFLLWRALRAIVYRLSPILDSKNERPLTYAETVPVLEQAGLRSRTYQTHGFIGFCLFMNSDVLFFNRLFRFIPGIRTLTRMAANADRMLLSLPPLRRVGLQVIGVAMKPGGPLESPHG